LIKLNKLQTNNIKSGIGLINFGINYKSFFKTFWGLKNQIISKLIINVNLYFECFHNKKLVAFLIGNLIFIEKVSEYEIIFIYVKTTYYRKGLANYLLNNIYIQKCKLDLKKIFQKVAENNITAIEMYRKNNFELPNIRNNYYLVYEN